MGCKYAKEYANTYESKPSWALNPPNCSCKECTEVFQTLCTHPVEGLCYVDSISQCGFCKKPIELDIGKHILQYLTYLHNTINGLRYEVQRLESEIDGVRRDVACLG